MAELDDQFALQGEFSQAELAQVGITAGVGSPGYSGNINAAREAAFAASQMPGQGGFLGSASDAFIFAGLAAAGAIYAPAILTDVPGVGGVASEVGLAAAVAAGLPSSPDQPTIVDTLPEPVARASPIVAGSGGSGVVLPSPATPPYQAGSSDPTLGSVLSGIFVPSASPGDAEAAAYRKRLDAMDRTIAKSLGKATGVIKRKKRKQPTIASVGAKIAERAVKGLFKPGLGRALSGATVRGILGPLGAAIGLGLGGVRPVPYDELQKIGDAKIANRADQLQPIKVTAKVIRDKRGVYTKYPFNFPTLPAVPVFTPASPPTPASRFAINPKVMKRVQAIGAALDALKKKRNTSVEAPLPIAPLAAIGAAPMANITNFTNIGGSTSTRQQQAACSCKPKKRGPARKCLERATVVYKTGRMKGKPAGTKCIRYAT